jgi:hypothetical protein
MSAQPEVIIPSSSAFTRNEERGGAVVALQPNATPMQMLAVAMNRGMDAATLKELMELARIGSAAKPRRLTTRRSPRSRPRR